MLPEIFTKPEFYDNFGLGVFLYLLCLGFYYLKHPKKKLERWVIISLIVIGFLGLIVDFSSVAGILKTLNIIP